MAIRTFLFLLLSMIIGVIRTEAQQLLSIKKAMEMAQENNLPYKNQKLDIGVAASDIITAKLRYNPKLNNQTLQLTEGNKPGVFNSRNRQVWWQVTQNFYVKGQRQNKIDFAIQNYELSKTGYLESRRQLKYDVALQWLSVWMAKMKLDLTILTQAKIDTLVIINQNRLKNQVITSTDLLRTEILARQYNLQSKILINVYKNEINSLKLLLGVKDSIAIDTEDKFIFNKEPSTLDSLLNDALQNRSDIRYARGLLRISESNIKLQKSFSYPQPEAGFIYNPQNSILYLGVYATLPIPAFDRNQGEIQKSKILKQQSVNNLQATELMVNNEVQTSYRLFQAGKQNLMQIQQVRIQAQEVFNTVRYAYLKGGTTIIDLLEAQRTFFETEQIYYDSQFLFRKNYLDLLYTSGLLADL
jgi:cobalt-zinc-cadmium efflux system outer membrane protein